jgi:hypothetical protein
MTIESEIIKNTSHFEKYFVTIRGPVGLRGVKEKIRELHIQNQLSEIDSQYNTKLADFVGSLTHMLFTEGIAMDARGIHLNTLPNFKPSEQFMTHLQKNVFVEGPPKNLKKYGITEEELENKLGITGTQKAIFLAPEMSQYVCCAITSGKSIIPELFIPATKHSTPQRIRLEPVVLANIEKYLKRVFDRFHYTFDIVPHKPKQVVSRNTLLNQALVDISQRGQGIYDPYGEYPRYFET